jgi:molecular chaperone DnaK
VTEHTLAVDFGTCFSSALVVTPGRDPQPVPEPTNHSFAWPSAIYDDGAELLVGEQAERRKRQDPAAYRAEFKRDLGQDAPIVLGTRSYRPHDLVKILIARVRTAAQEQAGGPVSRAVITVPASYARGDPRRAMMIAAAEAAGFTTVELLPEPVAAVFAPVIGPPLQPGQLVLVYDFGGGTFDTALIRIGEGRHEVLGSAALDDCGGSDLDAVLIARLASQTDSWLTAALDATAPGDKQAAQLRFRVALGDFARGMKHQLTGTTRAEQFITPSAPSSQLSREELEELAAPLLGRTMDCCRALVRRLDLTMADLSAALLVGGTTRMPVVAAAVADQLGLVVRQTPDPDLAVVRGAAEWARSHAVRPVAPLPFRNGTALLRWELPAGPPPAAQLLRWLVGPGEAYPAGAPLARVRLPDGSIWDLVATVPGRFDRSLAVPGAEIRSGEWIGLSGAPA